MISGVLRAAICVMFTAFGAEAEEYWTTFVGSYHFDREHSLNEFNPGIGYGRMGSHCGAEAGIFLNSYDRPSVYGFGQCETSGKIRWGFFGGLASGYQELPLNYAGIAPIGGLQVSSGNIRLRMNSAAVVLSLLFEVK